MQSKTKATKHVHRIPGWAETAPVDWVLRNAARDGLTEVVTSQLALGTAVDSLDVNGNSALLLASESGHAEAVKQLLAAGAQTEVRTKAGMTPYLTSCMHGHTSVAEELLRGGADPQAVDNWNQSAMLRAVEMDHPEVVRMIRRVTGERPPEKFFWYYPEPEEEPQPEPSPSSQGR